MQLGLIECDGAGPFSVIRGARVTARLLGMPPPSDAPPGTTARAYRASWDDLVLPGDRVAMMREYVGWICHRSIVIDQWAGRPSGGPVALFSGPSGTGKTLAASVIASELGWPLYRVDLGSLISKYIGETEKNLNVVFSAVHGRPAVLQFDEADSLFGKRGEIRDARDRYANLEVSCCDLSGATFVTISSKYVLRVRLVSFNSSTCEARDAIWAWPDVRFSNSRKYPAHCSLNQDSISEALSNW